MGDDELRNLWAENVEQCAQRFLRDARLELDRVKPADVRAHARARAELHSLYFANHVEHGHLGDFYARVAAWLSDG